MITADDVKNFLRLLNVAYPTTWSKLGEQQVYELIELWTGTLKSYTREQVESAISSYLKQRHEFPPTVGHIIELITQQSLIPQEVHATNYKSSSYERGKYLRAFLRELNEKGVLNVKI